MRGIMHRDRIAQCGNAEHRRYWLESSISARAARPGHPPARVRREIPAQIDRSRRRARTDMVSKMVVPSDV